MNRSKDLDTVAPDDDIVISSTIPEIIPEPPKKKKKDKTKTEIKIKIEKPSEEDFNQKVYSILGHTKNPFSSFCCSLNKDCSCLTVLPPIS